MNPEKSDNASKRSSPLLPKTASADSADQAYQDFTRSLSYNDYLQLDSLLAAHRPVTQAHDEHLFITVHHISELWLSLIVRELGAAMECLAAGVLDKPQKMLSRVVRAQEQLTNVWSVLKTMTPADYLEFRWAFGQASGFQSAQYRMVEIMLGNRNPVLLRPHQHSPELHQPLQQAMQAPSVYDLALRLLAQRGFDLPPAVLERDLEQSHVAHPAVLAAWVKVYQNTQEYWELYELAEKLIDVEDNFRQWRFNHLTSVERTIGMKRGSGGTSGVGYLRRALEIELFPELWQVRTEL